MAKYKVYRLEQINQVKNLLDAGLNKSEIARQTKIPRSTIKTWEQNKFEFKDQKGSGTLVLEELISAIVKSYSFAGVLRRLGLKENSGSGYKLIKKYISEYNLDISHFTGQSHNKGKKNPDKWRPIEDYLDNKVRIGSHTLREKLVERGLKEEKCENCGITEWLGEKAPLALHHIDENHFNNNLNNLSILCRNCHAIQHKPKKRKVISEFIPDEKFIDLIPKMNNARQLLIELGLTAYGANYKRIKHIQEKYNLNFIPKPEKPPKNPNWRTDPKLDQRKVTRPLKEELEILVYEMPMTLIGKKYGVSDNSIRKWCKNYGIDLPKFPLGYWISRHNGYSHEEAMNCQNKPKTNPPILLTKEQVAEILELSSKGFTQRKIAKDMNLHFAKVGSVCRGESYKHFIKEIEKEKVSP